MASAPSGVGVKDGIALTAGMAAYLKVLRGWLTSSVPLTVTSAERSPEEQAAAMKQKLDAKGEGELFKVYASNSTLIRELLAAPRTTSAWATIIRKKGMKISRHLAGNAVDLRTRDLTSPQVDLLKKAVTATGGRAYLEYDHLHVDLPAKYAAASLVETGVKRTVKVWLATSVVGAVVVGALIYRDRRRRALPGGVAASVPAPALKAA